MANQPDPFLIAEGDILNILSNARGFLASYIRIRRTATSSTSPELLSARSDLTTALEELTSDLQDLVDSVEAVEGDPYKYGIDVTEVERRRQLVASVGREVEGMREEVTKTVDGAPNGKSTGLPNPEAFDSDHEEDGEDGYAAFEEQRQQELLQEQDEQLDGVFRTVGNLRMQADEMGRELEEQGELLDSVDTLADRVGGKLQNGIKKVGWVIKKNEGKTVCLGEALVMLKMTARHGKQLLHCYIDHGSDPTLGPRSLPLRE